jgi:hypothetical protein
VAAYVGAEDVEQYKGFKRYLWFEILELDSERTPYDGLRLPLICPMVSKGRCSPHGKYAKLWSSVTGRRPSRADRLTTAVFRGRLFRVRVRTVVADHNQRSLARINQYSVVDGVVDVEAGRPSA